LTAPEIHRLVDTAQYRADYPSEDAPGEDRKKQVVNLKSVRMRRQKQELALRPVGVANHATRLRYFTLYFEFLIGYYAATLPKPLKAQLDSDSKAVLAVLRAQIPKVPTGKRGARQGISEEDQGKLLEVIKPGSVQNPWKHPFVQHRNWLIVVLLLASGMRRGELLNLRLNDLSPNTPVLSIVRRLHAPDDRRLIQPTPKTRERDIELRPAIMNVVWKYIAMRREIPAARKHAYLIVGDDGIELAYKNVDRIFATIRRACPGLTIDLSSHVMRHTWNDRFSEQAELMGLSEVAEQRARNEQQGWADDSKSAATYTRRYAAKKGREISLRLQEKLDVSDE
jgi:integrase